MCEVHGELLFIFSVATEIFVVTVSAVCVCVCVYNVTVSSITVYRFAYTEEKRKRKAQFKKRGKNHVTPEKEHSSKRSCTLDAFSAASFSSSYVFGDRVVSSK